MEGKKKKTKAGGKISGGQVSFIRHVKNTEEEADFNANGADALKGNLRSCLKEKLNRRSEGAAYVE